MYNNSDSNTNNNDSTGHNHNTEPAKKDMYVLSLDTSRLLWIIASFFFLLSLFFLFGYYTGSLVDYEAGSANESYNDSLYKTGNTNNNYNGKVEEFSNIKEVRQVTQKIIDDSAINIPATEEIKERQSVNTPPKISPKQTPPTKHRQSLTIKKQGRYLLQIATYKMKSNANFHKKALEKKWKNKVRIAKIKQRGNETLYVLLLGNFSSLKEAQRARYKILKEGKFSDSFIVKR